MHANTNFLMQQYTDTDGTYTNVILKHLHLNIILTSVVTVPRSPNSLHSNGILMQAICVGKTKGRVLLNSW